MKFLFMFSLSQSLGSVFSLSCRDVFLSYVSFSFAVQSVVYPFSLSSSVFTVYTSAFLSFIVFPLTSTENTIHYYYGLIDLPSAYLVLGY